MTIRTRSFLACALALVPLLPATVRAQVARVELHPFSSMTLTDEEFLLGKKDGKPVVVAGELRIPKPGTDRLPAVVLLHGSGGVVRYVDDWVPRLNALGVATFVIDSFTPRGLVNTAADQDQLGRLAMIIDGYRALALLAQHPRIRPDRIAVMGFSRGGQAALYSSLKRFQRMHGRADAAFALYILLYPQCGTTFLEDEDVADRPIRIFHGAADDYVPVAGCRKYVERLRKAGKDVTLTEYEGANHMFDSVANQPPVRLAQAQTLRNCQVAEVAQGKLVNVKTQQPFTYSDPCVERGATIGYNAKAAADAEKDVTEQVKRVLLAGS